jgi:PKD repeat protein
VRQHRWRAYLGVIVLLLGLGVLSGCLEQKPGGNHPPQAQFSFSPITPKVGEDIVFDASASKDPDGQIVEYLWDFGDGSPAESGSTVIHAYGSPGQYTVKLTVTDDQGLSASLEKPIHVIAESGGEPKRSVSLTISPAALTWGDGAFWVADAQEPKVYKIDPQNGQVLVTIDVEQINPEIIFIDGVAWADGRLWIIDGGEGKLYQLDLGAQKVVRSLSAPGPQPTGIAWDGSALWVADAEDLKLYKINPVTGKLIDKITAPGAFPQDLAWDGQYLWNQDPAEQKIFKLDPRDGTVLAELEVPSADAVGIAWDGQSLWIADGAEQRLLQLEIPGL